MFHQYILRKYSWTLLITLILDWQWFAKILQFCFIFLVKKIYPKLIWFSLFVDCNYAKAGRNRLDPLPSVFFTNWQHKSKNKKPAFKKKKNKTKLAHLLLDVELRNLICGMFLVTEKHLLVFGTSLFKVKYEWVTN